MKIKTPEGKEREVSIIGKVSSSHTDIYGNTITEEYVKVLVKGRSMHWINWYPLEGFKKLNPGVKV